MSTESAKNNSLTEPVLGFITAASAYAYDNG